MKLYQTEFELNHEHIPYFSESLEEEVSAEEIVEDNPIWRLKIIHQTKPDKAALKAQISALFQGVGAPCPEIKTIEIADKNWVEENQKSFPPITTDKFHIYSEFSEASENLTNIKINAGMAFGTGQHETTYLCLEAIGWLADEGKSFGNILDLGCGSGILGIAAAKTWNDTVTATDNDPVAVKIAQENAIDNHTNLECFTSEGFALFKGYEDVKFDLILANILMNPLLEMAEDMKTYAGGTIVLSGFKTDQTDKILEKYTALGFTPARIFVRNHWVAAVLCI